MTSVRITAAATIYGSVRNAGINLWLTKEMNLVYRQDWSWATVGRDIIYTFKDERMSTAFALRWA
jgi:hypothetical protein